MSGSTTLPCSCKSDFQDKRYGSGNRIHNLSKDAKKATCTVCGKVKLL